MYRFQSSSDIPLVSASGPSRRSPGGGSLSRPRRLAGVRGSLLATMLPGSCPVSGVPSVASGASRLHHELDYVNGVAEQQTSPADAEAVITGSGFSVRKDLTRNKDPFAATYGLASGEVKLDVRATSYDASYYWQWSTDQKNWVSLPETRKASTMITGLTPATTY